MIYDHLLTVYTLEAGSPLQKKLVNPVEHYYCNKDVYYRRFWTSIQAGSQIDRLVEIPYGDEVMTNQYCVLEDGHVYRIEQAQPGKDADGLPINTLNLRRMSDNYDITKP